MKNSKPRRILYRIIIPFILLYVVATLITLLSSAYYITLHLDQTLKKQMDQIAIIISKSTYILNPAILNQLKDVISAEIILFDINGNILNATFSPPDIQIHLRAMAKEYMKKPFIGKDVECGSMRYRTVLHPIIFIEKSQAFFSLWVPTSSTEILQNKIILVMGGFGFLGIIAMSAIGFYIARTITAPVESLVKVTEKVSRGDLSERVQVTSKDEIGSLAGSFNYMIDQLQNFEQRLVETEKLATAGQIAAGMAHEVRNPLTSIKMMGQVLISRMKDDPQNQKVLLSLVKEIDRLDRIIQEIIDRTRPAELKRQWSEINILVEEVLQIARESFEVQRIFFNQCLQEALPQIYIDQEKIKQVLWNLILNAKEAMPRGGELNVSTNINDSRFIEICIKDKGPGIIVEDVEKLFQPFFTTKPEGVGLGLTMSRKIIEKHGGKLSLENRVEGGTNARVLLPIKQV